MSVTTKVLLSLVMSVVAILVYISVFTLGFSALFWYDLPATFAMIALLVYFSIANPEEE